MAGTINPQRLAGRRIILTGAASGMGRAMARRFAAEGAKLGLLDISAEPLAAVAKEVGAHAVPTNIADVASVERAVESCSAELGGVDGVVNAAGILRSLPIEESDAGVWKTILDVNLVGPSQLCRLALPHLRAAGRPASIVNVASLGGLRPNRGMSAYGASKGGLIAFTKALALELGPENIRANAICPGFINTAMTEALYVDRPEGPVETLSKLALGRAGDADEVAALGAFLISDEAGFITGAAITVDGGVGYH